MENIVVFSISKKESDKAAYYPLICLYTEQVIREANIDGMGISLKGRNLTTLRYADDTDLIADNVTSMRKDS